MKLGVNTIYATYYQGKIKVDKKRHSLDKIYTKLKIIENINDSSESYQGFKNKYGAYGEFKNFQS